MLAPLVVLVTLDRSPIRTQAALGEERWLGTLAPGDRATFLRVLEHLVDEPD
jgi:hypothetical protein